ncbi:MAG: hypothetical protein PVSMB5_00690 [Ktedonobacteraceae bacterium]
MPPVCSEMLTAEVEPDEAGADVVPFDVAAVSPPQAERKSAMLRSARLARTVKEFILRSG